MNYINFEKMYCVLLDKEDSSSLANGHLTLWNYLLPKSTKDVMFLHATQPIELVYNDDDNYHCSKLVKFYITLSLFTIYIVYNVL